MKIEDVTPKDIFRLIGVMLFDSTGYNPELMLTRIQMGIAIYMTPSYLPFF